MLRYKLYVCLTYLMYISKTTCCNNTMTIHILLVNTQPECTALYVLVGCKHTFYFSHLFYCIFIFIRQYAVQSQKSWVRFKITASQIHGMLIPLLSQQDAPGRCTFSMTILWRGSGEKGAWICSSRKHFTDYAELLWRTGATYGRQFDIQEFRFTSIKMNSLIQTFTAVTQCSVAN